MFSAEQIADELIAQRPVKPKTWKRAKCPTERFGTSKQLRRLSFEEICALKSHVNRCIERSWCWEEDCERCKPA